MDQLSFLEALWIDGCYHHLWTLADKRTHWAETPAQAAELAMRHATASDVYFGPGATVETLGAAHRPRAEQIEAIPAIWVDVDVLGEGHAEKAYPPTFEEALKLFADPEPSIIVHSGGGWQAYWLFREPWFFDNEADRKRAGEMLERFQKMIRFRAQDKGWTIDATHDLPRILRVPGTWNRKLAAPREVTVRRESAARYNPSDIDEILDLYKIPFAIPKGTLETAGEFVINTEARVCEAKFAALAELIPEFLAAWEHRKQISDPSPSGWDMSLASYAAQAGWSDQEIVDLLIAHRRKHGEKLKMHRKYYETTVGKARKAADPTGQSLVVTSSPKQAPPPPRNDNPAADPQPEPPHPEERQGNLEKLSEMLGARIFKIVRTAGESTHYLFRTEKGDMLLKDIDDLLSVQRFRRRAANDIQLLVSSKVKQSQWDTVVAMVMETAVDDVEGESAQDRIKRYLTHYLATVTLFSSWDEACEHAQAAAPHAEGDRVWISAPGLAHWVSAHLGDKTTINELFTLLHAIGCTQDKRTPPGKRATTVRLWGLPADLFPVATYRTERPLPTPIRRGA